MTDRGVEKTWSHHIFGCFDNCGLCIFTFFCPCWTFGRNAGTLDESCAVCGVCCLLEPFGYAAHVAVRGQIRGRRQIEGSLATDMLWVFCCPMCALVQEAAEVKEMWAENEVPMVKIVRA